MTMTATKTDGKKDIYGMITDKVLKIMEGGVVPWRKPWTGGGNRPMNYVSKAAYRGVNVFVLAATAQVEGYDSQYWMTFNQAKAKGGKVRKGEKGTPVVFWKVYRKKDEATGEEKALPILRYFTVFNERQIDGLPEREEAKPVEHEPIAEAEKVVEGMPNRPEVTFEGDRAFYRPSTDTVTIPEKGRFRSAEEFYSTLFHELGHSTGHESRLNRKNFKDNYFGDKEYSKEELCAEMTAAFLCGHCGIESVTIENSAAYLRGWMKALKDDRKMLVNAAAQAQKAADYILDVKREEEIASESEGE